MSDKRSVATDALDTLGTAPLDDTAKRDAIHLAVEPVVAGMRLFPGDHVTIKDGVAERTAEGQGLGIVDPFLHGLVRPGERFWFVMYPRTIKSLRHVWSHPAFADEPVAGASDAPARPDKAASERWLRAFIDQSDCPSYETVIGRIIDGDFDDEYIHFDGKDAHGAIPPEFWDHAEIVVGRKLESRPFYFSCSC